MAGSARRLGVLVNAGGFAHNQEMRDQYQPGTSRQMDQHRRGRHRRDDPRNDAPWRRYRTDGGNGRQPDVDPAGHVKTCDQARRAGRDRCAACDPRRPVGRALHERGRLLYGLLQGMLERNKTVPAVPSWAIFDSQFIEEIRAGRHHCRARKKPQAGMTAGLSQASQTPSRNWPPDLIIVLRRCAPLSIASTPRHPAEESDAGLFATGEAIGVELRPDRWIARGFFLVLIEPQSTDAHGHPPAKIAKHISHTIV